MVLAPLILPFLPLLVLARAPTTNEPLVCNVSALTSTQRARHQALGERLLGAVVLVVELPDGYELAFDLSRISDARERSCGVVEVAEWVDLESRCCPFLDFGIDVVEKGSAVRMRLTGRGSVKKFLRTEIPILARRK